MAWQRPPAGLHTPRLLRAGSRRFDMLRLAFVLVLLLAAEGCVDDEGQVTIGTESPTSVVTGSCDDQVIVFLRPETSDADLSDVAEELVTIDGVEAYSIFDQDQTYAEFQDLFADRPQIVDSVTPDILPPSVRVQTEDDDTVDAIRDRYEADSRVREVATPLDPALVDAYADSFPGGRDRSCEDEAK